MARLCIISVMSCLLLFTPFVLSAPASERNPEHGYCSTIYDPLTVRTGTTSYWYVEDTGNVKADGCIARTEEDPQAANAQWRKGLGLSTYNPSPVYYELEVLECSAESHVWFGVGGQDGFASGYSLKGFLYAGNLSDGRGLMRGNFGPWTGKGDIIGMRCEILDADNGTLEIYFSLNGEGLGKAFSITDMKDSSFSPLFPIVSFSGGPSSAAILQKHVPPTADMELAPMTPRTSIAGEWKNEEEFPSVTFFINTELWNMVAKVRNVLRVGISATPPHPSEGNVSTTLMAVSAEEAALEAKVTNLLASITSLSVTEDGNLAVEYDGKQTTLLPFRTIHTPVTRDEITWL